MTYLMIQVGLKWLIGVSIAAAVKPPSRYIDATVVADPITGKQLGKGLLVVGILLVIVLLLLIITWRTHSGGWLPLVLLFASLGVATLLVLGLVGYGLSTSLNATHFAQRRDLAQELDREGIVITSRLVKRWWGFVGGSEASTRLVAFESGPHLICQAVSKAVYEPLRAGQLVWIRHLPNRPDVARLEEPQPRSTQTDYSGWQPHQ